MSLHQADLLQGATHELRGARHGDVALLNSEATFGFIDYYVFGTLRRLPAQFFKSGNTIFAWIDSGGRVDQRLMVEVITDMKPSAIGNFNALLKTYRVEAIELLKNKNLWNECINHEAGLLLLFQTMHEIRTRAISADEALGVAMRNVIDLRNSEQQAIEELMALMSTSDFSNPDQLVGFSGSAHAVQQQQFSLA